MSSHGVVATVTCPSASYEVVAVPLPGSPVLVDASVELGHYDDAADLVQQMLDLKQRCDLVRRGWTAGNDEVYGQH
mgnify:CR=1 FL=1